ncbi:MAG TPA: hypothetical protein VF432_33130 [Thermoanaerobaculia bacterium]
MHSFIRILTVTALLSVSLLLTPAASAETLRFAWPDGASAKVRTRSEGRNTGMGKDIIWDMTADFTMRVKRAGEHVRIERAGFSGWKGTYPPSLGGGADRFTDMIPTFIVTRDGKFVGIEGQEAARALINRSVEQSGGFDAALRNIFETATSDAALHAMASDHWATLVLLWEDVELDAERTYELRNTAAVPQFGGGELEINGEVRFVKEAPCATDQSGRRCVHFHSETSANREQSVKLVESLMKRALGGGGPVFTDFDQRFKVDIILDKATTLPQQLTLTRLLTMAFQGSTDRGSDEMTKTYDFEWTVPGVSTPLPPAASVETLRFAWPDGASAKVRTHSEGHRIGLDADGTWDMTADFTMHVKRAGEHVRIERAGFSGWKGSHPPLFGGGGDRFADMIPTIIVSSDGKFVGFEGQDVARALMRRSMEQSGGFDAASRKEFETGMNDAALRVFANDFWFMLVDLWQGVKLGSDRTYERRDRTMLPLGEFELTAEVRFVKEGPCAAGPSGRRCLHFHSKVAVNREQVVERVESHKKRAAGGPVITDLQQQSVVDIVVDKATTLPQQLIITRLYGIETTVEGRAERGGQTNTKTYHFDWTVPGGEQKK